MCKCVPIHFLNTIIASIEDTTVVGFITGCGEVNQLIGRKIGADRVVQHSPAKALLPVCPGYEPPGGKAAGVLCVCLVCCSVAYRRALQWATKIAGKKSSAPCPTRRTLPAPTALDQRAKKFWADPWSIYVQSAIIGIPQRQDKHDEEQFLTTWQLNGFTQT